jgi:hypothetical protein
MTEQDQTIILTCKAGTEQWTAVCPDYPENVTSGRTSVEALRQYNFMLWQKRYDNRERMDKCRGLLRDEVRRAAGIPEWALRFHRWLLWNKKERESQYDRMAEIVRRISAAPNLQDATYEEVTNLSIAEFKGLVVYPVFEK